MLLLPLTMSGQDNALMALVQLANGTTHTFTLGEPMSIRFVGDSIVFHSAHVRTSYTRNNVKLYRFTTGNETTSIDSPTVQNSNVRFLREGNILRIFGASPDTRVSVYSLNGIRRNPTIRHEVNAITVDFSQLPPETYIVQPSNCPDMPAIRFLVVK